MSVSQPSDLCVSALRLIIYRTFLWWTAGQCREREVHDITADDGGLKEPRPRLFCRQRERQRMVQKFSKGSPEKSGHDYFSSRGRNL